MEAILSHQTAVKNGRDTLVVDSVLSEYSGTQEQQAALKILNNKEPKKNCGILKFIEPDCSKLLSVEIGKETNGVYVSSHFISKDDSERRIPFRFWMRHGENPNRVREKMEEYARLAHMELNPADSAAVEQCLSLYPKVKTGVIVAGIIILILLLMIIF